jgi:hypothetical protein
MDESHRRNYHSIIAVAIGDVDRIAVPPVFILSICLDYFLTLV